MRRFRSLRRKEVAVLRIEKKNYFVMTIFKIWQEDNFLKIQLFLKATRSGREVENNVNKLRRTPTVQLSEHMN